MQREVISNLSGALPPFFYRQNNYMHTMAVRELELCVFIRNGFSIEYILFTLRDIS